MSCECPRCGRYTCSCSQCDLEDHLRHHKYDMGYEAERCITRHIDEMRWNKIREEERLEEESHERAMEEQRIERQRQEREEEEAYWEERREEEAECDR